MVVGVIHLHTIIKRFLRARLYPKCLDISVNKTDKNKGQLPIRRRQTIDKIDNQRISR